MSFSPEEEEEIRLLTSFRQSKLWKYLSEYLEARSKALIHETCKSDGDVWMNKGAQMEIQKLARAPELVLKFYQDRQKQREESLHDQFAQFDPDRPLNGSE